MSRISLLACALLFAGPGASPGSGPAAPAAPGPRADEFFERHVRPVLVEHCLGCHGEKKQRGGLRLDSAAGLRKGSDNGPVVVPGEPDKSALIKALRHDGPVKMPPKGKLPDRAADALAAWVRVGAPWPAASAKEGPKGQAEDPARTHWAFQPVRKPAVPAADPARAATPVDAFILARLKAKGLALNGPADRRTLIRRATFDLHGLPPTPEEVAAFENDPAPDAFARVVDRLLASPRYGERWGRHWLDVARYADTKGYVRLNENPHYGCSWTYRDYVIRAFNEDLPYDQFVREQIAVDLLPRGEDTRALAALGFLTLGERFVNSKHDIIDDRIDVVTRGLLGLTVTCARCHDHKFDPVPTADYYALHGVFASSAEPRVPPMIAPPGEQGRYAAYLKELGARTGELERFLRDRHAKLTADFRARAGDYLLAAQKEEVQANFLAVMFLVDAGKDLNPVMVQRWARLLGQTRKAHHPVLAPWHTLAALPPDAFAARAPEVLSGFRAAPPGRRANPVVAAVLAAPAPRDLADAAARYGELFRAADRRWQKALRRDPAATRLDDPAWEEIRLLLYGPDAPPDVPEWEVEEYFFVDTTAQQQFHQQQRRVEDWIASPGAAPHALTLVDLPTPVEPRVFLRGNAANPGPAVPRQFLSVLSRGERQPFRHGSGRLELARAVADRDNPLTARVMVNRVWMHHFGAGLVRTPGDFGTRGDLPTHPELLDFLASRFMEDGWSVKRLHRLIMLSAAYQQASDDTPRGKELDPDNLLWWKTNRRRLDWESLRDALLAASGSLDPAMGGPGASIAAEALPARRSVYLFLDRQNLPPVLRTFDFAAPDASSPQRHQTTVPQQALFLMNSPFLKGQVRRLAARPDVTAPARASGRIDRLHRLLYGRAAAPEEIALGETFLADAGRADAPARLTAWEEYVQVLVLANEFAFVD